MKKASIFSLSQDWQRAAKQRQESIAVKISGFNLKFQNIFFSISSSCIHKNLSFPLVSSQRTEKMPEVHVRQKLVCTFPAMQLKPHIIYKPLSRLWILILNGWICQYEARKISMKLISWSNSINGAHKNQIYIEICVGSAFSNTFKTYYILYNYETYFGLKIPPSPSRTRSPRYSANLMFGILQQTEVVQHLGRMASLFGELIFLLECFLLKAQYQHQKLTK